MSALPLPPAHLLSVTEFGELGDDEHGRYELQEGRLLVSPSPTPAHMIVMGRLFAHLDRQLPPDLQVIPDVDIDLELVPPERPGFSRRPDLVVVHRAAVERVRCEGGMLRAREVVVVIEIVSPGSRRTDRVVKHGEYADAGIGHYWIIDLDTPLALTPCRLAAGSGYQDPGAVVGAFASTEPFPVQLDLDRLL